MAWCPSSSSSSSSAKFIEAALKTTGPLALSYVHQRLKWTIRDHLLSLMEEFPSLKPSCGHFTHDDGTTVRLLNVQGSLLVPVAPPVMTAAFELTIWLHQGYPFVPPIVYLSAAAMVSHSHPFVDPSGAAATPYLMMWQYPFSNVCDLARNLVYVFTLCPPFVTLPHHLAAASRPPPLRGASKSEAIDLLYAFIRLDMAALRVQAEEDVRSLMVIQAELGKRARAIDRTLGELQREKESLGRLVAETEEQVDVVRNWLWANRSIPPAGAEPGPEEAFELDGDDGCLLGTVAACLAIDDVVKVLDDALRDGAVPLDAYLKKMRGLFREQFFLVPMLENSIHNITQV